MHIAIIMDGNGRFAERINKPRLFGHKKGVQALFKIVGESQKQGIDFLTLFCLSTENFKRSETEIKGIFKLLSESLCEKEEKIVQNNIRLKVIGRRDRVPSSILKKLDDILLKTKDNKGLTLTLAIDYGYQDELNRAITSIIKGTPREKAFDTHFLPDVDLLIRTGKEKRISNFIMGKLSYAELYFTDILWPSFQETDLVEALKWYKERNRKFGGLNA